MSKRREDIVKLKKDARRGAVLPWVLGITLAAGALVYSMYAFLPQLSQEQQRTLSMMQHKIALTTVVDYVAASIQKGVCFDPTTWAEDGSCDITNDSNDLHTRRLLIGGESLQFLRERVDPGITPLTSMEMDIDLSEPSADSPLQIAIDAVRSAASVEGFEVTVTRHTQALEGFPASDKEVELSIRAELIRSDGFVSAVLNKSSYFVESRVMAFPRELGTFSLILPRDFRLDGYDTGVDGDATIPTLAAQPSSGGIKFLSPVFINRNVVIPSLASDRYSPIRFLSTVFLGAGGVFIPNIDSPTTVAEYRPSSGGAKEERYFTSSPRFGGFARGLRVDNELDRGLYCLFGLDDGATNFCDIPAGGVDTSVALANREMCTEQQAVRQDPMETVDSELVAKVMTNNNTSPDLNIDFSTSPPTIPSTLDLGQVNLQLGLGATEKNNLLAPPERTANAPELVFDPTDTTSDGYPALSGAASGFMAPVVQGTPSAGQRARAALSLQVPDPSNPGDFIDLMKIDTIEGNTHSVDLKADPSGADVQNLEIDLVNARDDLDNAADHLAAINTALTRVETKIASFEGASTTINRNALDSSVDAALDTALGNNWFNDLGVNPSPSSWTSETAAYNDLKTRLADYKTDNSVVAGSTLDQDIDAAVVAIDAAIAAVVPESFDVSDVANNISNKLAETDAFGSDWATDLSLSTSSWSDEESMYLAIKTALTTKKAAAETAVADEQEDYKEIVLRKKRLEEGIKLEATLNPVNYTGDPEDNQPHVMNLDLKLENYTSLLEWYGVTEDQVQIQIETWEIGSTSTGLDTRVNPSGSAPEHALTNDRTFTQVITLQDLLDSSSQLNSGWSSKPKTAGATFSAYTPAGGTSDIDFYGDVMTPATYFESYDVLAKLDACAAESGGAPEPGLVTSFAYQSQNSWHYRGGSSGNPASIVDMTFSNSTDEDSFYIYSRLDECVIPSTATFVAGFLTCNKLTINDRSTPLEIVGTIIAGELDIHENAAEAGITWSSVYHDRGLAQLRANGVLSSPSQCVSYDRDSKIPIWHPRPSVENMSNDRKCFADVLRTKSEPMQWTSVDPDCVLESGSTIMTCKKQVNNWIMKEIAREESL